ncbi:hypothetical protein AUEXF2481DRAFT_35624 [Aureobasidium subglaciale EXF-2481]|uniref:Transcription factor domain-containing protein n=1 Tax=Aureobasidium subglaciale (strain EXF-2481) TaxID=1043005 RepID=A0A074YPS7_AURSE|nr:uncharacterized protein AUEXF2481DRAFT_35624 [Aureobasidium subglaciale EXF-2481]KEQ99700.1 hypothetical protein AUEXF2481DRAFT_35624 [Aureobasidium subglaciale EXF-2481]
MQFPMYLVAQHNSIIPDMQNIISGSISHPEERLQELYRKRRGQVGLYSRSTISGAYAISAVPHPHVSRSKPTVPVQVEGVLEPSTDVSAEQLQTETVSPSATGLLGFPEDHAGNEWIYLWNDSVAQSVLDTEQPTTPEPEDLATDEDAPPDALDMDQETFLCPDDTTSLPRTHSLSQAQHRSVSPYSPSPSLQHALGIDWTSIYKGYWGNNCLSALHPIFQDITILSHQVPAVDDAIVALAACNLSRVSPQATPSRSDDNSYQPHPEHWASSKRHYGSALKAIRFLSDNAAQSTDPQITVAILVLISCLEASVGNALGFHVFSRGIAETIGRLSTGLNVNSPFLPMLAAWMQTRYHTWWIRLYFSTFSFQLEQSSLSAPAFLEENAELGSVRRAMVLSNLCESHRLHQKMLLGTFFPIMGQVFVSRESTHSVSKWYKTDMYRELLNLQAVKLDLWEESLPLEELPASLDGEAQYLIPEGLLVMPVQFSSHHAAMNYAYYISARLMQDAPIDLSGEHITDSDHFVFLLLRVAAGISHQTCLRENTYTIGLSSLLLAALLHTCSLDIGLWIEDWLDGFQKLGQTPALEEGSFPLEQISVVVSVINQQRRLGRNVFAISQAEDDGGGRGKAQSYHSQDIKVVWLHGRERANGALFQEPVRFGS